MTIKGYLRSELKVRRREYYHSLAAVSLTNIEKKFISDLLTLPFFESPPQIIGCYYAVRDEVPTLRLIQALSQKGFQIALPHIHDDLSMTFHAFNPGDPLEATSYGIPQPYRDAPILTPHIVIVPMLGFNRNGHRIGYGQGHYDRALHALRLKNPLVTIGLAFTCQEISDNFIEQYDIELDWIVTETEVIQPPKLLHVKGML
jgi:5-formyltetrahydrofolate cyclo-ligase